MEKGIRLPRKLKKDIKKRRLARKQLVKGIEFFPNQKALVIINYYNRI